MKRRRIAMDASRNVLINPVSLEQWDPWTEEEEVEYAGHHEVREIPLLSAQRHLARLVGNHWPGIRSYRVNRLAFKLQRALKYLLFNIRHGLTKRLDWYGERLNALQTNETLGDL